MTDSRLTDRRGKPESELETRRVIEHFDPRAVKIGDGRDQAEPQTVSRRVAAVFEPVKALEDLLVFVRGNSGSVVGDRDDRLAIDVFVRDHDLPPGAAMLDRIVDEIGDGVLVGGRALGVEAAPEPYERVRLPLTRDRAVADVAGVEYLSNCVEFMAFPWTP